MPALAAIDPAALRPHSDRSSRVRRTETWIHKPVAFHGDVPEISAVFLLRAAPDPESDRLLVTSYTHAGLAFEAEHLGVTTRKCSESTTSWTKHERAARWCVRCTLNGGVSGGGRR